MKRAGTPEFERALRAYRAAERAVARACAGRRKLTDARTERLLTRLCIARVNLGEAGARWLAEAGFEMNALKAGLGRYFATWVDEGRW